MTAYRRTTKNLKFITSTKQKSCSVCKASIPDKVPFLVSIDYKGNITAKQFRMCFCCANELIEIGSLEYEKIPVDVRKQYETNRFVKAL